MSERLSPQPWMTAPETAAVFDALERGGAEVRFVGGAVRDAWLGRPVKDIDLATTALPPQTVAFLEAAGLRAIPTGIDHGTVTALSGGKTFEITTLRRDVETDGRHAVVAYTTDWREDAARRDFTMNALSAGRGGRVFDYFGGLPDLAAGRVRFVGEAERRIREDVLRALRFFRFHAHYGRGEPDPAALAACAALAASLSILSGERIRGEILRLLTAPDPAATWRLMDKHGILAPILPDATNTARLERLSAVQTALGDEPAPIVRLAATLPPDRSIALRVAERLKLSNAERDRLVALATPPRAVSAGDDAATLRLALYRLKDGSLFADLLRLDAASHPDADLVLLRKALATEPPPPFPIHGRDLLDLGLLPGQQLGTVLKAVEAWWIGGDFRADRAACLAEARQRI